MWGSTPHPDRFTPGKKTRYPFCRKLGGPQSRSEWVSIPGPSRPWRVAIPTELCRQLKVCVKYRHKWHPVITNSLRATVICSLPCSQKPTACPCTEPDESNTLLTFCSCHINCNVTLLFIFRCLCQCIAPFRVWRHVWHFTAFGFLKGGVVSTLTNPSDERPPLVLCPRLLNHYIRRYPPYLEAVASIRNDEGPIYILNCSRSFLGMHPNMDKIGVMKCVPALSGYRQTEPR
jgi:hypothetical protein